MSARDAAVKHAVKLLESDPSTIGVFTYGETVGIEAAVFAESPETALLLARALADTAGHMIAQALDLPSSVEHLHAGPIEL